MNSSPGVKKHGGFKIKYSHLNLIPPLNPSTKLNPKDEVNLSGFQNFIEEIDYDYSKILEKKQKRSVDSIHN